MTNTKRTASRNSLGKRPETQTHAHRTTQHKHTITNIQRYQPLEEEVLSDQYGATNTSKSQENTYGSEHKHTNTNIQRSQPLEEEVTSDQYGATNTSKSQEKT